MLNNVTFAAAADAPNVDVPFFGHLLRFHVAESAQGIKSVLDEAHIESFFPCLQMIYLL